MKYRVGDKVRLKDKDFIRKKYDIIHRGLEEKLEKQGIKNRSLNI